MADQRYGAVMAVIRDDRGRGGCFDRQPQKLSEGSWPSWGGQLSSEEFDDLARQTPMK